MTVQADPAFHKALRLDPTNEVVLNNIRIAGWCSEARAKPAPVTECP